MLLLNYGMNNLNISLPYNRTFYYILTSYYTI